MLQERNNLFNTVFRIIIYILLTVLIVYGIYKARGALVPLIIAFVLSYLVNPVVELLQKWKLSRSLSIILTYLVLIGILVLIAVFFIPQLIEQFNHLISLIPEKITEVEVFIESQKENFASIDSGFKNILNGMTTKFLNGISQFFEGALGAFTTSLISIFSQIVNVVLGALIAFYIVRDLPTLKENVVSWIPQKFRGNTIGLAKDLNVVFGSYVRGQLMVSLVMSIIAAIIFKIIGLDSALSLGVILGVLNIIPYFGPLIAAIPVVLVAGTIGFNQVIFAIIAMVVIQQLESNIVTPKIMSSSLGLHPLAVIISLIIGGKLFGIVGMILSMPLAAMIKVVLDRTILQNRS